MKMKSILKYGVLLVLCSMLLCACGKQNDVEAPIGTDPIGNDPVMEPEIKTMVVDDIGLITCAEGGVLYGTDKEKNKIFRLSVENTKRGEVLAEDDNIQTICYENGKIYYPVFNKLYELDVETKEVKELATFGGDWFDYEKIVALKNSVFILRRGLYDEEQSVVRFDESDEYQYDGECLEEYDLRTGTIQRVPINNIRCIAEKSDDELLIYAYDEIGGFYFTTYQATDKRFSKKVYRDNTIRNVRDIAYDSVRDIVIFTDMAGIMAMYGDKPANAVCVYEKSGYYLGLQCQDGITYALKSGESDEIIRLVNAELNLDVQRLKGYTTHAYTDNAVNPDLGFQLDIEEINATELTTKILAGDSDYDFLLLDSGWDIGYHIFRTGVYAPMNEINGVEAYLDSCHGFAKDAATGEDGTIWMIPYEVGGAVLGYNEELFAQMGLTPEDIDTLEEVYALAEKVVTEETAHVDLLMPLFTGDIHGKYHANYGVKDGFANYNTDLYQKILKVRERYEMPGWDGSIDYRTLLRALQNTGLTPTEYKVWQDNVYKNTLLCMERIENISCDTTCELLEYEFFHAASMPDIEEGVNLKEEADVYYLVINPRSENLPWVKLYVEKLCKELQNNKESFLIKDNTFSAPLLNEVMDILTDAQVTFLYPSSITSEAEDKYLSSGQSFEDTAEEIERVMNMYLNE